MTVQLEPEFLEAEKSLLEQCRELRADISLHSNLSEEVLNEAAPLLFRVWHDFYLEGHFDRQDQWLLIFMGMLFQRPAPWIDAEGCLPTLKPSQYFLTWAWELCGQAMDYIDFHNEHCLAERLVDDPLLWEAAINKFEMAWDAVAWAKMLINDVERIAA